MIKTKSKDMIIKKEGDFVRNKQMQEKHGYRKRKGKRRRL